MISAGRPDSVGGGVVAEIFRDRHKPARLSGGGGVVAEIFRDHNKGQNFFSGNRRSGSLKSPSFGNIFLHFPRIWKFSEIHCRKKKFTESLGGPWPPLATPLHNRQTKIILDLNLKTKTGQSGHWGFTCWWIYRK